MKMMKIKTRRSSECVVVAFGGYDCEFHFNSGGFTWDISTDNRWGASAKHCALRLMERSLCYSFRRSLVCIALSLQSGGDQPRASCTLPFIEKAKPHFNFFFLLYYIKTKKNWDKLKQFFYQFLFFINI